MFLIWIHWCSKNRTTCIFVTWGDGKTSNWTEMCRLPVYLPREIKILRTWKTVEMFTKLERLSAEVENSVQIFCLTSKCNFKKITLYTLLAKISERNKPKPTKTFHVGLNNTHWLTNICCFKRINSIWQLIKIDSPLLCPDFFIWSTTQAVLSIVRFCAMLGPHGHFSPVFHISWNLFVWSSCFYSEENSLWSQIGYSSNETMHG